MEVLRSGGFCVNIDVLFPVIPAIMVFSGFFTEYVIVLVSILFHELAHIITALALKGKVRSLDVLPLGFKAAISDMPEKRLAGIAVYSSGPFVNVLLCILFFSLRTFNTGLSYLNLAASVNIYLAVFNLLPALPLDGGQIMNLLLADRVGFFSAGKIIRNLSFIVSALLIASGIVQSFGSGNNFGLLLIGIYMLFNFKRSKGEAALMNITLLLKKRSLMLDKGVYPVRHIAAMGSRRVGEVLKHMDFNKFHIVYIMDSHMKLIGMVTEQDVLDSMLERKPDITLEQLFRHNAPE